MANGASEEDTVYERQGFGRRLGFGERPGLVIIDFVNGFADPEILGGGNISDAIRNTTLMLASAREKGIPIAFTRHIYADDLSDLGLFAEKLPANRLLTRSSDAAQIVPELEPEKGEYVIDKHYPSAFFSTDFANWLTLRKVDTLIVTGCTTSGCVRASTVDALGYGFRPMVVRDCVGDRALSPHEASLFDLDQKYADVLSSNEVMSKLDAL